MSSDLSAYKQAEGMNVNGVKDFGFLVCEKVILAKATRKPELDLK